MELTKKIDSDMREIAERNYNAQCYLDLKADARLTRRMKMVIRIIMAGLIAFILFIAYLNL